MTKGRPDLALRVNPCGTAVFWWSIGGSSLVLQTGANSIVKLVRIRPLFLSLSEKSATLRAYAPTPAVWYG